MESSLSLLCVRSDSRLHLCALSYSTRSLGKSSRWLCLDIVNIRAVVVIKLKRLPPSKVRIRSHSPARWFFDSIVVV